MSAEATVAPASASAPRSAPLSERTAVAILGSMILLILALTAILIETTWIDPAGASDQPVVESASMAQR